MLVREGWISRCRVECFDDTFNRRQAAGWQLIRANSDSDFDG